VKRQRTQAAADSSLRIWATYSSGADRLGCFS
jgi:hypothetical protein